MCLRPRTVHRWRSSLRSPRLPSRSAGEGEIPSPHPTPLGACGTSILAHSVLPVGAPLALFFLTNRTLLVYRNTRHDKLNTKLLDCVTVSLVNVFLTVSGDLCQANYVCLAVAAPDHKIGQCIQRSALFPGRADGGTHGSERFAGGAKCRGG